MLHAVPVLFGCQISISGLPSDERKAIAKTVTELGGHYFADLNKSCTHLITSKESIDPANGNPGLGPKIQFALKWDIPIVEQSWLMACQLGDMYVDERAHLLQIDTSRKLTINPHAYDDVGLEDVQKAKDIPQYLEGCHVYLGDGLDERRLTLLKKLILIAGGTRYSDHYHGSITHFIVHNQLLSSKELDQLRRYPSQPIVVHDQWLLACFVAKARLEPEVYQIDPAFIFKALRNGPPAPSQLSQATTLGGTSQARSNLWATKKNTPSEGANWMVPHRKNLPTPTSAVINTPPDSTCSLSKEPVQQLFNSITLFLHASLRNTYEPRVKSLGGIFSEECEASYCVYPLRHHQTIEVSRKGRCVNEIWLLQCIGEKRLLAFDDIPFFKPIIGKRAIDILDCRSLNICPTGFVGLERDYYARLATALGGTFSEAFSKQNTHLLCKSDGPQTGPKLDYAMKRGIPCVTEDWLIACAKEGCVVPVDQFKFGSKPASTKKRLHVLMEEEEPSSSKETTHSAKRANVKEAHPKKSVVSLEKENKDPVTPQTDSCPRMLMAKVQQKATPITPLLNNPSVPTSEQKSMAAASIDTPLRRDFNERIKQATEGLLLPSQQSLGPTQAISKESLSTLLNGLVFSISQRLWHRREELYDLVTSLGGTFLWAFDISCTHYLHQGNQAEETFREFKMARQSGKHIVSPWWLNKCKEEARRLDESLFPHHYNPNGGLVKANSQPTKDNFERVEAVPVEVPDTYSASLDLNLEVKPTRLVTFVGSNSINPDDTDPQGQVPSSRPSSCQSLTQNTLGLTIHSDGNMSTSSHPGHFMFSGLTNSEREIGVTVITDLGATTSSLQNGWEPNITHLITGFASKSEKYLAACASGIWILRQEYIEACKKEGRLLPEGDWEWQPSWNDSEADAALKAAPRNWRLHLQTSKKKGAFDGWVVLLAVDQKRLVGFTRILQAGAAKVITIPDLEENNLCPEAVIYIIYDIFVIKLLFRPSTRM